MMAYLILQATRDFDTILLLKFSLKNLSLPSVGNFQFQLQVVESVIEKLCV